MKKICLITEEIWYLVMLHLLLLFIFTLFFSERGLQAQCFSNIDCYDIIVKFCASPLFYIFDSRG